MICANIIGMRGLCEATDTRYYVDDYGISLNLASKLAHDSFQSGRELFLSKLALAWRIVENDIAVNGFNFNKVLHTYQNKFTTQITDQTETTFPNSCVNAGVWINYFKVKVIGTGTLRVLLNGTDIFITNPSLPSAPNDVSDETVTLTVDAYIPDNSTLEIISTGVTIQDAGGTFAEVSGYIKCDKSYYLCKYSDLIVFAVIYKLCALILNEQLLNPRYNDFIAYSNEGNQLALKIAQLDTSLTLVTFEELPQKKGAYQRELESISKILPVPKCDCCFECEGTVKFDIVRL